MKTFLLMLGTALLLVGCSSTNEMGGTGNMYQTDAAQMNRYNMSKTGVLGVGTGNAGMGAGTGIGSGSTGSGL